MAHARAALVGFHERQDVGSAKQRFKGAVLKACSKGDLELLRSLLKAGADANSKNWVRAVLGAWIRCGCVTRTVCVCACMFGCSPTERLDWHPLGRSNGSPTSHQAAAG